MSIFGFLPDLRQRGKMIYPLDEVLLCMLAILAGAESFVEIARFGAKKLHYRRHASTHLQAVQLGH